MVHGLEFGFGVDVKATLLLRPRMMSPGIMPTIVGAEEPVRSLVMFTVHEYEAGVLPLITATPLFGQPGPAYSGNWLEMAAVSFHNARCLV